MSDWPMVRFEELADSSKSAFSKPYGSAIMKDDYVPDGVPVVRGVNLANGVFVDDDFVYISDEQADRMPGANLTSGDLVFTHRGTIGQVSMIPWNRKHSRYVLSTSHVKARLDTGRVRPEFYYYYFQSPRGQQELLKNASVVGVPGIAQPVATIKSLSVPYPSLSVQNSIVEVLGALDNKAAVNVRIVATSDDLGSVLLEEVLLGDSSLAEVPLGSIAGVNRRKVAPVPSGDLRYIDISSVSLGGVEWPNVTSWDDAPSRARRGISQGDTIWSTVRPNRRSYALILDNDARLVASTGFAVLTPVEVGAAFLYEVTKRDEFVRYLESVAEGSAYPAVRAERFEQAAVPLPSSGRLEKFESVAMPIRERAHAAAVESRSLAQLRDTLLPKLMSGEIHVRDAEKVVEDVVL